MRRWRGLALGVVFLGMTVLPGQSCGPFFTEAVFVVKQPASRAALMDGKLGIVWPEFGTVDTALVYRVLQGPAFTAEEKKQMLAAEGAGQDGSSAPGMASWIAARKQFTGQDGEGIATDATVPGQQWQSYLNCLDDAFATAALTLRSRESEYASAKPAVVEWVKGQDAVFSNCAAAGQLPAEAEASMPGWLHSDRAYQTAAAHFYRAEWRPAEAGFAAIADDKSSPWREVAAYMVARTLVRQGMLSKPDYGAIDEAPMRAAQAQLQKIVQQRGKYAGAARELLSFVDLRIAPGTTAARLGDAIAKPDPQLHQDLIDLRYAVNRPNFVKHGAEGRQSELVDWVLTTRQQAGSADAEDHALERWRATKSAEWLMSALMSASSPQPDLMAAAAALPRSSPAWTTVTYHRLRLTSDDAAVQAEIARLLPEIEKTETASTVNAFRLLAQKKVGSLDEFIKLAAIEPAGYDDGMGDSITTAMVVSVAPGAKGPTMAGLPVDTGKRFTVEAATVLNERLPLETLAAIVERRAYPKQLQFELAMAVWTRAVLLGKPEVARTLTAALLEGEPGWKQWLQAYDDAKTDDDRQAAALLALMRFPSVRPYVNAGSGREDGFVGYSAYRDNWWCARMGEDPRGESSYSGSYNYQGGAQPPPAGQPMLPEAWPQFVSPAMKSQAKQETAALGKIGDAPQYFGSQALAWAKAHPGDPRGAELLGFAFRAMRNGCNLEQVAGLRHEVFNTLHAKYGQSEWARRYARFESDSQ
jgi:hypothetical protein